MTLGGFRIFFMFCIGFLTPGLPTKHRILYTVMLIPYIFVLNPIRGLACFLYNMYDFNWIRGEKILKVAVLNDNKEKEKNNNTESSDKNISSEK
jgi:hypothetical protein